MTVTLVDLYCASYPAPPVAATLDIDETVDIVHGGQQLSFWNGHYGERCFLPIHVYDTATGRPVAMLLRTGKTPWGGPSRWAMSPAPLTASAPTAPSSAHQATRPSQTILRITTSQKLVQYVLVDRHIDVPSYPSLWPHAQNYRQSRVDLYICYEARPCG